MAMPMDYLETGTPAPDKRPGLPAHSAGNNPSTWAGLVVLFALGGLAVIRKSFRRFM